MFENCTRIKFNDVTMDLLRFIIVIYKAYVQGGVHLSPLTIITATATRRIYIIFIKTANDAFVI